MTKILLHCHLPTIGENLSYLGIAFNSKKFSVISFTTHQEYVLCSNDNFHSRLIIEVPEGWSHPRLRLGHWEWKADEGLREYRTIESFHQCGLSLMPIRKI